MLSELKESCEHRTSTSIVRVAPGWQEMKKMRRVEYDRRDDFEVLTHYLIEACTTMPLTS